MQCPSCGHEAPAGSAFCNGCGAKLVLTCASCGATPPPGSRFCNGCGATLGAAPASAAPERSPRAYTPKHLAEKILQSKSALEGERKQVTVLFADVKGSMELAGQLDPEQWHCIPLTTDVTERPLPEPRGRIALVSPIFASCGVAGTRVLATHVASSPRRPRLESSDLWNRGTKSQARSSLIVSRHSLGLRELATHGAACKCTTSLATSAALARNPAHDTTMDMGSRIGRNKQQKGARTESQLQSRSAL